MRISKQWLIVGIVLVVLVGGATLLTHLNAGVEGVAIGARAPSYRAVNLASRDTVTLPDAYRGHVTLVNIWATWCGPCRVEMPSMQEAYAGLKDQGFRIAAVSIDEGPASDVLAFQRELGLTFDILQDRSTRIQGLYQTTGVPESFLLDKRGTIVKRVIGAHDWNSPNDRELITRLLAEPGS